MELLLTISVFIFSFAILVLIGFLITWIVGKLIKRASPKKVGKLGMIITLPFVVISLFTAFISVRNIQSQEEQQQNMEARMNKTFKKSAESFQSEYLSAGNNLEKAGTNIYSYWGDAIDNNTSDDFDVDSTVTEAVAKNYDKITSASDDIDNLEKDLKKMESNDTNKYDYSVYNKAYKNMKSFYRFVSSPNGSYMDFSDKMTKLDDNVTSSYDDLTE